MHHFQTDEVRDYPEAATGADVKLKRREERLMCYALIMICSLMRPRSNSSPAAKPSSAFQVLLAVQRVHRHLGAHMVSLNCVRPTLKGLYQKFIDTHGIEALRVQQKHPISYDILTKLLRVKSVALGRQGTWSADDLQGVSTRAVICLLYTTGFRKAEVVRTPLNSHLTRSSVTWVISGHKISNGPSAIELMRLRTSDYCVILPNLSKCDATGEVWGHKPIFLPYRDEPGNACHALALLERVAPCAERQRGFTPLFSDNDGVLMTPSKAINILNALLCTFMHDSQASSYSWHSFRIGLATRLGAAGCPDSTILAICRWQNPASLLVYKRLGVEVHTLWHDKTFKRTFSANAVIPEIDNGHVLSSLASHQSASGESLARPMQATAPARTTDGAPGQSSYVTQDQALLREAPLRMRAPSRSVAARPLVDHVPPSDTSPLTAANAKGRLVLVPKYSSWKGGCDEHGGRGWSAVVATNSSISAMVRFVYATTSTGRRYKDMRFPLNMLTPL